MKLTPFLDRLIVQRLDYDEHTKSKKLVLPTGQMQQKYDATRGKILAMGPGAFNSFSGKWVGLDEAPYSMKVGMVIMYPKAAAIDIDIEGTKYHCLSATDVYGKLEEGEYEDSDTNAKG